MSKRPIASLSLDLDNKWAYLRAAGRDDWQQSSSILPVAIDRIVDVLGSLNLPLTVFLVGRDLEVEQDVIAIERFGQLRQWEPANHSWNHLPWMHTMHGDEITREIVATHEAIQQVTSQVAVGFRGPGFSCPAEVMRVLKQNHYIYDASMFPTSMAPVARAVFLARTNLKGQQREKAKKLYGGFASMRQPNVPHRHHGYAKGNRYADTMWEVPVTVMPWTRTPIHFSYLTYLASFSVSAAQAYFSTTLAMCRTLGVTPSLLLHPPDFLGIEDDGELEYLPGMKWARSEKLRFIRWALRKYASTFDVHTIIDQLRGMDASIAPARGRQTDSSVHPNISHTPATAHA